MENGKSIRGREYKRRQCPFTIYDLPFSFFPKEKT